MIYERYFVYILKFVATIRFKVSMLGTWYRRLMSSLRLIFWPVTSTVNRHNLVESCEIVICSNINGFVNNASIIMREMIRRSNKSFKNIYIYIEKFVRNIYKSEYQYLSKRKFFTDDDISLGKRKISLLRSTNSHYPNISNYPDTLLFEHVLLQRRRYIRSCIIQYKFNREAPFT